MSGPSTTVNRENVLAGPGQLWRAIFSTSLVYPADTDIASPPGAGWTDVGGTSEGLTVTVNQTFFSKTVDQVADSLGEHLTERSVVAATSLAEGTLENLAFALNHDPALAVTTGAGFKKLELEAGQDAMRPVELAVIIDGWAPGGFKKRRVTVRRVNSMEAVGSAYQKDGQFFIPVSFRALYVDAVTSPVAYVDEL